MTQPVITQFWPIFPTKSDGHEVVNNRGAILRNGPTAEQLDRTPNEQGQCDYYRLIDDDEPKHIDWRKKLGGMLLREIGGKQYEAKWSQCILYEFPKGYRLYEHIKSKVDGQTKAVKTHSGGGHDRQDAYLYGYPKGPKKRFRSPQQFFPHLLWLSTDESGDHENCACQICSPMQLEIEKPAVKQEIKPDPAIKKENVPSPTPSTFEQQGRPPVVQAPVRRPSTGAVSTAQSPSGKPVPPPQNAARIKPPTVLLPTSLPQPRSLDQQVDALYGKFLCRTGEVAWFFRDKTKAWGLGLIVRRWIPKDGSIDRAYMIQPLSHPYDSPSPELVTTDQHLKPWLAWSAPNCTYAYLQQNPTLTYNQIEWNALLSGQFGEGIADVDASILAAKSIDTTYTLFERLKTTINMGQEERHWNGVYLGAEKLWNGEPVRLRLGSGNDLMVITDIIERTSVPASIQDTPSQPTLSKVQVIGDIYTSMTLPVPDPSSPPNTPPNNNLPIRMREDMRWRNQLTVPASRTLAYWKLMASQTRLDISEVKGRWYETSIVFVEPFKQAIQKGDGGNGIWMNARGDATGIGKTMGTPKLDRLAAFATAIPKGTALVDGLEPPAAHHEQVKSVSGTADLQGLELATANGDAGFALDDFMNLDGMDESALPFGEEFTF
ncbi:hypothetical protein K505DRAFT_327578 [Melanomma pulvis-pyrius CBS 109.77]|uniref:Cryptic loci regulator 2 N-terminal domain-containing protein n=1 Tax=Melanomma pulvis-pyrius CBS 109.77 TaxID=1314802 RepID=A0A6A6X258_9PLEO|nr:hypothetical protein K505DRAFT_327578 [Melanomma pulvis-pyrius CBS 109.77]